MLRKTFIFGLFACLSLALALYSVFFNVQPKTREAVAVGFGVSPPIIDAILSPGDMFSKKVMVIRSTSGEPMLIKTGSELGEMEGWVNIDPANSFLFKWGDLMNDVKVTINIPDETKPGRYRGQLYFYMQSPGSYEGGGVAVRKGGRVELDILVQPIGEHPVYPVLRAISNKLYERYRGWIVTKAEDNTKLYYVNPKREELLYVGEARYISEVIATNGLGISNNDFNKISNPKTDSRDMDMATRLSGIFLIKVEDGGSAWFVNPADRKRYRITGPDDVARLAAGLSNEEFNSLVGFYEPKRD